MTKMLWKVVRGGLVLLVVLIVGVLATVQLRWKRRFEAPFPSLKASTDPAVIERGRYLVEGPGHCTGCHVPSSEDARVNAGEAVDLKGGRLFDIPPGKFYSANLTPDPETGIGRRTDAELFRLLRHDVRADGRATLPVMPFQTMADSDLVALVSYLRSRPPVKNEVPEHAPNLLGKFVYSFLLAPPPPPPTPPAPTVTPGPTAEYGKYLAHSVANCYGCHTNRDLRTGAFIGEPFAGGLVMPSLQEPDKVEVVAPNLTKAKSGRASMYTEDQFVARIKGVKQQPMHTHMPWISFAKMTDDDLRAIYRYLQTVPPVENDVGQTIRPKTGA
jgi:mono/diheme cytochrome c family protein